MADLLQRLRARLRNRHFDADLAEELRLHEELKREELEREGVSPDSARSEARRALGNVTLMREVSRGVWIRPWVESTLQDVRYALRTLVRQPVHSLTAGTVLVLAIGLNTSLFTVFKALALEPWPVKDASRVVLISARADGRPVAPSVDEYRFMRAQVQSLSGLAAHTWAGYGARLQTPGRGEAYLQSVWASANVFDVLGVTMQLGSGFVQEDDAPGNRRAPLVISDTTWRAHFGADPSVIGRAVTVSGQPFTIAGVLERRFDGIGRPVDLWMPLSAFSSIRSADRLAWEGSKAANCCVSVVGRIAPGMDRRQVTQELQLLHERFASTARSTSGRVEISGTAAMSALNAEALAMLGAFRAGGRSRRGFRSGPVEGELFGSCLRKAWCSLSPRGRSDSGWRPYFRGWS
jgi:hypothetical protein